MPAGGAGSVGMGTAWTFRSIVPGGDSMVTRSSSAPLRSMSAAATTVTRLDSPPAGGAADAVAVGLSSAVDGPGVIDADGPGDAGGDPSGLADGEADSTGAGLVVASRLGSGPDDERGAGEVDGSGAGSTDGCDPGAVVGPGVGACVGSGVGACEPSGLASGDGLSSAAPAVGSWAATGAGTMMALASSSAACRRTMPPKGARPRRECCVIESSPVQRSVNVTHGGPQCTRADRWRCLSEPVGCACVGG